MSKPEGVFLPAPLCAYLCVLLQQVHPAAGMGATHSLVLALLECFRPKGNQLPEIDLAALLSPDWQERLQAATEKLGE